MAVNSVCRRLNKPFYAGGCYGLFGYIFCDLLQHYYIAPSVVFRSSAGLTLSISRDRSMVKDLTKDTRVMANYCSLDQALRYRWTGLKKRQVKEVNPALFFAIIGMDSLGSEALNLHLAYSRMGIPNKASWCPSR
jgi:ubiquitin-like 1-activating enzyme E1 A